ncbi:MAG: hypothetical protein Q4E75_02470 [bacterium]|nr:hypothetical protein [bacterium]
MKFFCEYCGCRIDANENNKCPNCGASYKKNSTFLKLEEERKQREEKNNQLKNEAIETTLNGFKFSRKFILLPIFFIIFVFLMITIVAINNFKIGNNITRTKIDSIVVNGINNYGIIDKYSFMVTGYEVVTPRWNDDNKDGYECIKFYFQVKNTSDEEIERQDINCIVDGVSQSQSTFGMNSMPYFIGRDLTVKGDMEFIVPKDATSYDIRYGDYITIHIEK